MATLHSGEKKIEPSPGVLELLSPEGCGRLFLFQIKVLVIKDAHPAREDDRARERGSGTRPSS